MKILLFGTAALFLMASCSGNGGSEKTKEDSTHIEATRDSLLADSIAQAEGARQAEEAAKAAAEQARLDSIRQDSIRKKALERENFNKSLPDVYKLYNLYDNQRGRYLRSLGYKKSGSSYMKRVGTRSIVVKFSRGIDSDGRDEENIEITINGDNEALNKLYMKAKPLQNLSTGDLGIGVWKDKNKIIISASW